MNECTPKSGLKRGDNLDLKVAKKYISLRDSAYTRGHDFELSLGDLKKLLKRRKCYYTGIDLIDTRKPKLGESTPFNSFTLDRINPQLGYVPGNVVPCCFAVNQLKERLEHSDDNGLSLAQKKRMMKKMLEVL